MLQPLQSTLRGLRQPHNTFRVCVLMLSLASLISTVLAGQGRQNDDYYGDDDDFDDYLYDDYGDKKKPSSGGSGGSSGSIAETSTLNFVRLFVLRLVWGFASMFGFQEGLEDFMGGIFVPPGVEADDDFDLF